MAVHSFLVLEGKEGFDRGDIVEVDSQGHYKKHGHGLQDEVRDPQPLPPQNVAPLTEKECILLNAIYPPATRYTVYSKPGLLAWGVKFEVGDTVLARLPDDGAQQDQYATATIKWAGETHVHTRHRFGLEIMEKQYLGRGDTDGTYWGKQYFTCRKDCGLFLTLAKIKPPLPPSHGSNLQDRLSQLERDVIEKTQLIQQLSSSEERSRREVTRLQEEAGEKESIVIRLQGELSEREATVTRLQGEARGKEDAVTRLQGELREKEAIITRLQQEREHQEAELRGEADQYQHQLREEQIQRQQLEARIEAAVGYLRGEAQAPKQAQAPEMWELPRDEVHISQTILGTGGWGCVAKGTFKGQKVAVKCLHRDILSSQNEGRLRREISIMSQVRHPNLLLLIGAVLTVDGTGPLIVTELLDKSLRSAYEEGLLEEKSKVPVLRDVSSALTYLHTHCTPIIHRDVSSANVLLEAVRQESQWKGKLSDFGSANLSRLATTPAEGAAVYAAPEVSTQDRSEQTPKIDVYSFGVLVCEVCLCRIPPERQEFPSMLNEIRERAPQMFSLSRDCTNHAHKDRPTMREVLQRIDQLGTAL